MTKPNIIQEVFSNYGDYYDQHFISKTRKTKTCSICKIHIPTGSSHIEYKCYGDDAEYPSVPVCNDCNTQYEVEIKHYKDNGIPEDVLEYINKSKL